MSVQSITDHGAVPGGPDCAPAFQKAIQAAGDGGTVYIPPGTWVIESTVTTGAVNLRGDGWQSCIQPNVGAANDAVVVNPTPQTGPGINLVQWSGFSILGAAVNGQPCCQRGLVIDTVLRSVFTDVHVLVAAAEYGVYVRTGWCNTFSFVCSGNMANVYGPAGISSGLPALGHIRGGAGTAEGGLNANVFNCICEGLPQDLLHLEDQSAGMVAQGNNWITGTYEGTNLNGGAPVALGIYAAGSYGLVIHDVHIEQTTGIQLEGCTLPTVMNTLTNNVVLDDTNDAWIDQVHLGQLTIQANCNHTRLGTLLLDGPAETSPATAAVIDLSSTTVSIGSMDDVTFAGKVRHTSNALSNGDNLVQNGNFSRWLNGAPAGWVNSPGTVVCTGAGCTDPRTNLSPNAALFTATTAAPQFGYALPLIPNQWFTVSLYVYVPSGQALTQLQLGMVQGGTTQPGGVFNQVADGWTKLQAAFFSGSATEAPVVGVQGNGAGSFYIADAQASVGAVAPSNTFVPPTNVTPVLYLGGHSVSYGAAAPASGTWMQGDVVYNSAPVSGEYVGWVCTAAGSPGTWSPFGLIGSACARIVDTISDWI
jgi:hypothetical protein